MGAAFLLSPCRRSILYKHPSSSKLLFAYQQPVALGCFYLLGCAVWLAIFWLLSTEVTVYPWSCRILQPCFVAPVSLHLIPELQVSLQRVHLHPSSCISSIHRNSRMKMDLKVLLW